MESSAQQVVVGFVMSYVMQWVKRATWFPFVAERSDRVIKVIFSALVALCTALSIGVDWNAAEGILTLSVLTWVNVWNGLMAFGLSFATQHVTYENPIPAGV